LDGGASSTYDIKRRRSHAASPVPVPVPKYTCGRTMAVTARVKGGSAEHAQAKTIFLPYE